MNKINLKQVEWQSRNKKCRKYLFFLFSERGRFKAVMMKNRNILNHLAIEKHLHCRQMLREIIRSIFLF